MQPHESSQAAPKKAAWKEKSEGLRDLLHKMKQEGKQQETRLAIEKQRKFDIIKCLVCNKDISYQAAQKHFRMCSKNQPVKKTK